MIDERDPLISAAFAAANDELPTRDFTAGVIAQIDRQRKRTMILWIAVAIMLVPVFWVLAIPLQGAVVIMAQVLPTSLVQVGDGFMAQLLSPVNSIAGVVGAAVIAMHVLYRKIFA